MEEFPAFPAGPDQPLSCKLQCPRPEQGKPRSTATTYHVQSVLIFAGYPKICVGVVTSLHFFSSWAKHVYLPRSRARGCQGRSQGGG